MFLNLPRDIIRSTARFRLYVHTLRFETATWNHSNSPTCDLYDTDGNQDEHHIFPLCQSPRDTSPQERKDSTGSDVTASTTKISRTAGYTHLCFLQQEPTMCLLS